MLYKIVSARYKYPTMYGDKNDFTIFENLCEGRVKDGLRPVGSPFVIGEDIHQAFMCVTHSDFVGMDQEIVGLSRENLGSESLDHEPRIIETQSISQVMDPKTWNDKSVKVYPKKRDKK